MEKTLKSLLRKIAKIDSLRAGYLKRHIKFNSKTSSIMYVGKENVIKRVLAKFTSSINNSLK